MLARVVESIGIGAEDVAGMGPEAAAFWHAWAERLRRRCDRLVQGETVGGDDAGAEPDPQEGP